MSLGLPDVRVRLTAEGEAQVVAALRKVVSESQKTGRAAARGMAPLNTALSGARSLLAQVAAVASVGAFAALIRSASEAADQVGKMAQRVGASVTNLSALGFEAKTSGTSMETLTKAMIFLNRKTVEVQAGNKDTAKTFTALGLSARDFKGKDAAERFDLVAAALGRLKDSPEKTALGFAVFGRSVAEILPLVNALSAEGGLPGAIANAQKFGVLLSEDTARAAQAINDDFTIIKEQVIAGAARFVEGLAPAVHFVLGTVQEDLGTNQDAWKTWGANIGQIVAFAVVAIQQSFDDLVVSFQKIYNALGALARIAAAPLFNKGAEIVSENILAAAKAKKLDEEAAQRRALRFEGLGKAITAGVGGLPKLRPGTGTGEAPVVKVGDPGAEADKKRLEREKEAYFLAQTRLAVKRGEERGAAALNGLEQQRVEIEKQVNAGILTQAEGHERIQKAARALLPVLEQALARYTAMAIVNPFDAETIAYVNALKVKIGELKDQIDVAGSALSDVRVAAKDAFQDALAHALSTASNEASGLLDILRNIGLAIAQAVQQAIALRFATAITNAIFPTPGGHAAGGMVHGPGTGTSDSVPAMLSRGEYVVRASAVRQPGTLAALETINSGLASPVLSGPRGVRRYAAGGLVSGAGDADAVAARLTVGLDDGLVLRSLESEKGQRMIVRVITKNRRAASAALGNG